MPSYPWHDLKRKMPLWRRFRVWWTTRFILWRMDAQARLAKRWCRFCGSRLHELAEKRAGICPRCNQPFWRSHRES